MADFLRAWRFLTIVPLGNEKDTEAEKMTASLNFYSVVGALLGGILVLVCLGVNALHLGWAGNVALVSFLILLTGGLHLDGLADTADGLFCGRPREDKLEIMRDSRVGTMGVLAVWMILSLKAALLGEFSGFAKLRMLLFMPAMGRGAIVLSVVNFPYARKEGGKGSFLSGAGKSHLLVNGVFLGGLAFLLFGFRGLLLAGLMAGIAQLVAFGIAHMLGGLTGDTYGGVCEITETLTLFLGAILNL